MVEKDYTDKELLSMMKEIGDSKPSGSISGLEALGRVFEAEKNGDVIEMKARVIKDEEGRRIPVVYIPKDQAEKLNELCKKGV